MKRYRLMGSIKPTDPEILTATAQRLMKDEDASDAIVAMMREHGAPMTRESYLAWNWFDREQPYDPDPEEEMTIPTQFRLVEAGGEWHSEFDLPTGGVQ